MFDFKKYKTVKKNRYQDYLSSLNFETLHIEAAVNDAVKNILKNSTKSFVIYGEPQSGKTSMMIALTAKLLDKGFKFIIILVQDNLFLELQNRRRFEESTLSPSPKSFQDILDKEISIKDREFVIFCKKNTKNLERLFDRVRNVKNKVIIDDEADYATPNSKVNKVDKFGVQLKTKINERIFDLIGKDGYYLGVTATPARLDLNNTFQNENHRWVFFQPHKNYKGQDYFFPVDTTKPLDFNLVLLNEDYANTSVKDLQKAIYSFIVNATYINLYEKKNNKQRNFIMLLHTSGKKDDHIEDKKATEKLIDDLNIKNGPRYERHLKNIYNIALKKTNDEKKADKITFFVSQYSDKNQIGVLNSDKDNKKGLDLDKFSENPSSLYTIAIGGNIISRGITFQNLLSIYFMRGVKYKMQQDTYIQRARMFGNRDKYIKHFELTISKDLYEQWWNCFFLHRLSYFSAAKGQHQVWAEDSSVKAVSPASVDKANCDIAKGEMSFSKIKYNDNINDIIESKNSVKLNQHLPLIIKLSKIQDGNFLPPYIIEFIKQTIGNDGFKVALHNTMFIENFSEKYVDFEKISRSRGILGGRDYDKFPIADHHFVCVRNKHNMARMFYRCKIAGIKYTKRT